MQCSANMISASDILHGRVLIVDDKKVNVLLLERMLRVLPGRG